MVSAGICLLPEDLASQHHQEGGQSAVVSAGDSFLPEDLASQHQTLRLTVHSFCRATVLSMLGCQCGNPRNANAERRERPFKRVEAWSAPVFQGEAEDRICR